MSTQLTKPRAKAHREDEFTSEHHVYEPHRVGLPPMLPYIRELWRRREFAYELSRTELRAQHFNTLFGQLWLVINPLLLAGVYFVLVDIIRPREDGINFFAHLMAALFAYYFVSDAVRQAVKSVTSGGGLILNTAFPRTLLPLASVVTAFKRFLPTLAIYVPVHLALGRPLGPELLYLPAIFALFLVIAAGLAMLVAALQVYFRDLKSFLPYGLRVWLYACPILYYAHEVPDRYEAILVLNPLSGLLTAWSDVLDNGVAPDAGTFATGGVWALGLFALGALFFISREREFAVRL
jgi:ABC-type polysaccharide/polyol phosphate export permease